MKTKKIALITAVVIALVAAIAGGIVYSIVFASNTKFSESQSYVNIPTRASFEEVLKIMTPYLNDVEKFKWVAAKKKYDTNVKSGRFLLKKGMNSNQIINALRQNVPLQLAFNNQERLADVAGRIATQIEADSLSLLKSFTNPKFLVENGFTEDNVISMFIPNSYEVFWNTGADAVRDRMLSEYKKFWTPERVAKAKAQDLTPLQAATLASIVHKETVKSDERPKVAGVYLNRLHIGMKLEADPTVIYALKQTSGDFHQVIKRVLNKDLAIVSPYNTYLYAGLPPGPIAMPDITAIEAVLNPEQHDYMYFCASVTRFGYHEFAVTPAQHEANRQKYVAWINAQGIKR